MTPNKVFLIPSNGLVVRDPSTYAPLPEDGAEVELTSYWQRRIADGDVTVAEPKSTNKKPAKKAEVQA